MKAVSVLVVVSCGERMFFEAACWTMMKAEDNRRKRPACLNSPLTFGLYRSLHAASTSSRRLHATTSNRSEMSSPRRNVIHALQVQAFLDAADEVDVDDDTLADVLDGLKDAPHPHEHDKEMRTEAEDALELEENDGFDDPEYMALVEECTFTGVQP
jgi:hypothetical protein